MYKDNPILPDKDVAIFKKEKTNMPEIQFVLMDKSEHYKHVVLLVNGENIGHFSYQTAEYREDLKILMLDNGRSGLFNCTPKVK